MSNELIARIDELEGLLRALDERFDLEMRMRGFNPADAETTALPGPLAEIYLKRAELREEAELLREECGETADTKKAGMISAEVNDVGSS